MSLTENVISLTELVSVPSGINAGLNGTGNALMLSLLGNPRSSYDQECREVTTALPATGLYVVDPLVVCAGEGRACASLGERIIYEFRHGNFPNCLQYRSGGMGLGLVRNVVGLIFRMRYQRQTQSGVEPASTVFVYNLGR